MGPTPAFQMRFNLDNAEFADGFERAEGIARLLRQTAVLVEAAHSDGTLFDINGNRIGEWSFDDIEPSEDD